MLVLEELSFAYPIEHWHSHATVLGCNSDWIAQVWALFEKSHLVLEE
jgi:hypothetical protein